MDDRNSLYSNIKHGWPANSGYRNAQLFRSIGYGPPPNPFNGYPNYPDAGNVVDSEGKLTYCRYGTDDGRPCAVTSPNGAYGHTLDGTCRRGSCFQNEYRNRIMSYEDRFKTATIDMPTGRCDNVGVISPYTYY